MPEPNFDAASTVVKCTVSLEDVREHDCLIKMYLTRFMQRLSKHARRRRESEETPFVTRSCFL